MIANGQSVAYVAQALGVGLITHSDRGRGGQYVSAELKELIRLWHIRPSMSRATMADDPYDNVSAEPLWSRLKAKLLEGGVFLNVEDARTETFDYIEVYYNRERRHCAGSPVVAGLQKP